jgi:hypothetical protein
MKDTTMTDDARRAAAVTAGLDEAFAARLHGDTPEELAADAARLAVTVAAHRPPPEKTLDIQIAEAEQAGDMRTSFALKSRKLAELHAEEDRADAARYGITIHNPQESQV